MRSLLRRLSPRGTGPSKGSPTAPLPPAPLRWTPPGAALPDALLLCALPLLCAVPLLTAEPPLGWSPLAWLALAPMMAALRSDPGHARAAGWSTADWSTAGWSAAGWSTAGWNTATWSAAGWAFGLAYYGVQFGWLHHVFVVNADMGWLRFVNLFALLISVLALSFAAVLGLARGLWLRWGVSPLATLPVLLAGQDALLGVFPFGGVAWGSLAAPQAHTLAARLVVPLLGGAGLVLLLGLVNAGWGALAARAAGGDRRRTIVSALSWAALTVLCAWPAPLPAFPTLPTLPVLPQSPPTAAAVPTAPPASIEALLVPGTLSLEQLQAERDTPAPLRYFLGRTMQALPAAARREGTGDPSTPGSSAARPRRLAIWPESALPGAASRGKTLPALSAAGALMDTDFLLGSNGIVGDRETNAVYLVRGGVFDFRRYDKRNLVPFGEYVPAGFGWLFPRKVAGGAADYLPGEAAPVLTWRGERLGLAICFEAILPEHVRAAVRGGAGLLVAVANDAWLPAAAKRQHLQLAALRGLEAGRPLLRVANRGWSGYLEGGRAVVLRHWEDAPFWVVVRPRYDVGLFARWGLLPLGAIAAGLLALAVWLRQRRRASLPARDGASGAD